MIWGMETKLIVDIVRGELRGTVRYLQGSVTRVYHIGMLEINMVVGVLKCIYFRYFLFKKLGSLATRVQFTDSHFSLENFHFGKSIKTLDISFL